MQIIQTLQNLSARYEITVSLNNKTFNLYFYWSTREACWYFDVVDNADNNIINGIKIVPGIFLLRSHQAARQVIGGDFVLYDVNQSPQTSGVTFDNFGIRYLFEFATLDEMGAA